jgi:hypothetical protein
MVLPGSYHCDAKCALYEIPALRHIDEQPESLTGLLVSIRAKPSGYRRFRRERLLAEIGRLGPESPTRDLDETSPSSKIYVRSDV